MIVCSLFGILRNVEILLLSVDLCVCVYVSSAYSQSARNRSFSLIHRKDKQ